AEGFSLYLIERTRRRAAQFLVLEFDRYQPHPRVHDREVEPISGSRLIHQLGGNRGCEVGRISRRNGPPGWPEVSPLPPLLDRKAAPARIRGGIEISGLEPLSYLRSRYRFQVIREQRGQFEGVPVRVDGDDPAVREAAAISMLPRFHDGTPARVCPIDTTKQRNHNCVRRARWTSFAFAWSPRLYSPQLRTRSAAMAEMGIYEAM